MFRKNGIVQKSIAIIMALMITFSINMPLTAYGGDEQPDTAVTEEQSVKAQGSEKEAPAEEPAPEKEPEAAPAEDSAQASENAASEGSASENVSSSEDDVKTEGQLPDELNDQDPEDTSDADGSNDADKEDADKEDADKDGGEAHVLTNSDTPYTVTVRCGENTGIPEDAELVVKEMPEHKYIDKAEEEVGDVRVTYSLV